MELKDRSSLYESAPEHASDTYPDALDQLPPADVADPLIEAFKKDVDRTLLIENLHLSVAERLARFQNFMNCVGEMRGAALPTDLRERLFGKRR